VILVGRVHGHAPEGNDLKIIRSSLSVQRNRGDEFWEGTGKTLEGVATPLGPGIRRCPPGTPDRIKTDHRPLRVALEAAHQAALEQQIESPGDHPDNASVNQFDLNGHNQLHYDSGKSQPILSKKTKEKVGLKQRNVRLKQPWPDAWSGNKAKPWRVK
jgi:hypothetical protein